MRLMTIGFTRKSAEAFFEPMHIAGVRRLVDVRLNHTSQLAGFAKSQHLPYLLDRLLGAEYRAEPVLAPTPPMLERYKKHGETWDAYRNEFLALMRERRIEDPPVVQLRDGDCLLCSEDDPAQCHRRLVVEYLAPYLERIDTVEIIHLR